MKFLPHGVVLGLLVVVVVCTIVVPQVWPAIVVVALAGIGYLLAQRVLAKDESHDERLGADPPRS